MSDIIGYQIFDSLDRPCSNLEPTQSCLLTTLEQLWAERQDDNDVTYAIGTVYQDGDILF